MDQNMKQNDQTDLSDLSWVNRQDRMYYNQSGLTVNEKIQTLVYDMPSEISYLVALEIKQLIQTKQLRGQKCVLGLATGSTPTKLYKWLCEFHQKGELSFKNVYTFNLDEYYPMTTDCVQSYQQFMQHHLFKHIDIPKENVFIPKGDLEYGQIEQYCKEYEQKIQELGGIDLQILGIGKTGHIGFNEPGSNKDSLTRLIYLDKITKADAASDFFNINNVPRKAITMGVGTILKAKRIVMMAFNEGKSSICQRSIEIGINDDIPASYLQSHSNSTFYLDRAAAVDLTRFKCPWSIKGIKEHNMIEYDHNMTIKAVVWLSLLLNKSIYKLTQGDYEKNGLYELLDKYNQNNDSLNHYVTNSLIKIINDRPFDINGNHKHNQKVLIFSPHPDDDVICMGGTMQKLIEQGQDVYVAYQTSGSIGVFDHDVSKFSYFIQSLVNKFNIQNNQQLVDIYSSVNDSLSIKKAGDNDQKIVLDIKTLIREAEAVRAAVHLGVQQSNISFLNMPFYETGQIQKSLINDKDIKIVQDLIIDMQPSQIYLAGDLTDPHGTHRQCSLSILIALKNIMNSQQQTQNGDGSLTNYNPQVLLYRGAWQEWEIEKATLVVPLTPNEVYQKRMAIFKHQSQKDLALFPGSDEREFWQRAEDRNQNTAQLYNRLGMQEYQAMEIFVDYSTIHDLFKV